ncbi:MAG: FecR family protein [Agriterribacter sp.]
MDKSFVQLLAGYEQGTLTPEEMERFFLLLKSEENRSCLVQSIDERLNQDVDDIAGITIKRKDAFESPLVDLPRVNHSFKYRFWWAAAGIVILAAVIYYQNTDTQNKLDVKGANYVISDAAPGKNGAILKLSDGSLVNLDSSASGLIGQQHGTNIFLDNGQLKYKKLKDSNVLVQTYNTVETPAGRQFKLTLSDATGVWLNAGSSIKFPTQFTDSQRVVEVSGEVYMEVARNVNKPFIVNIRNGYAVEVLGTHFNINAYHNESALRTTLLEGKVKILPSHPESASVILLPGQEAREKRLASSKLHSTVQIIKNVNVQKAIAWKNGLFDFEEVDIAELMRQVERWYDVEVLYESVVPDIKFFGKMSRSVTLQGLLKGLKGAGVNFRLEGRQLIISDK